MDHNSLFPKTFTGFGLQFREWASIKWLWICVLLKKIHPCLKHQVLFYYRWYWDELCLSTHCIRTLKSNGTRVASGCLNLFTCRQWQTTKTNCYAVSLVMLSLWVLIFHGFCCKAATIFVNVFHWKFSRFFCFLTRVHVSEKSAQFVLLVEL